MIAYIGLGSNLDNPQEQLITAIALIKKIPGVTLRAMSSVYLSEPIGEVDQPYFYNQVVSIETYLSAQALLKSLQAIELKMGRIRTVRWGPRVIDCDLLLYGDVYINTDNLVVPHPHMTARAFVLYPLAEISPELVLPSGQNVQDLCESVTSHDIVMLYRT